MTFLAPLWFAVAGAAALGVIALHLVSTSRPPAAPFPTARFVPEGDARAIARTAQPTDLLLLALRIVALLLLGAGAAQPVRKIAGKATGRVLVIDRSRSALSDVRDSAVALWRPGDALVLFDSAAHGVVVAESDSLRGLESGGERGALSSAVVAALRARRALESRVDSVEMILISPITSDEIDAATPALVAQWRGRVRIVRTSPPQVMRPVVSLQSADVTDPLRPTLGALPSPRMIPGLGTSESAPAGAVAVVRSAPSPADSAAARAGTAIVYWPPGENSRARAAGVSSGNATLVAMLSAADTDAVATGGGHTVARWADGRPAALERVMGKGCIRSVRFGVSSAGDVALQPAFVAVAHRLLGPCARANTSAAASDSIVSALRWTPLQAPATILASERNARNSRAAAWLVAAALLLLIAELFVRRSKSQPA